MAAKLSDFVVNPKDFDEKIGGDYSYEEVLLLLNENCPEFKEKLKKGKVKKVSFLRLNWKFLKD